MADQKIRITEADLLFIRAKLLLDAGDPGQAARLFSELVNSSESEARAWSALADIFQFRLLDLDRAETCYNKAMELDPKIAATYIGFAGLLFTKGKFAEANAMLNQASDIPGVPADQVRYKIAELKESQGRYDEAIADYRKALLATFENKTMEACEQGMARCKIKKGYSENLG